MYDNIYTLFQIIVTVNFQSFIYCNIALKIKKNRRNLIENKKRNKINRMVSARALHYVLKIGDRGANINFFRNILGMKVNSTN